MRQFVAILRDSYREAMDGYVIYLMLGLSAILFVILASMSCSPLPAAQVVPKLVGPFVEFVPDRGSDRVVVVDPRVHYRVSDVQAAGSDVAFTLQVKEDQSESFRAVVARWKKPASDEDRLYSVIRRLARAQGKEIPETTPPEISQEEIAAVTSADRVDFVSNQIFNHLGIRNPTVVRNASGKEVEPFTVNLPGVISSPCWVCRCDVFFGAWTIGNYPVGSIVKTVESRIVHTLGASITLILAVIITSFFIPNMLRKGSLDLIISKPIGRATLLTYKYLGGLTFIFLLTSLTVFGIWIVMGLRSGLWNTPFLVVIPILTFTFAVLYSVSTLMAVLTRNAIAAILITLTFAAFLYIVGVAKIAADGQRELVNAVPENLRGQVLSHWPQTLYQIIDTLNMILPRTQDLDRLTGEMLDHGTVMPIDLIGTELRENSTSWWETIGLCLGYIVLFVGLACWRFKRRDS